MELVINDTIFNYLKPSENESYTTVFIYQGHNTPEN